MTSTEQSPVVKRSSGVLPEDFREYDLDFEGTTIHCYESGQGRALVFLHGSGAGAATLSNYRRVLGPLSSEFRVLAADLVGFGWSGQKLATPYFDMAMWVRQLVRLLDHIDDSGAIVLGHSLSGAIVLKAAAEDQRIGAVVTTATMGVGAGDGTTGPRWRWPATRDEVRQAVERTFSDKSLAEEAEVDRRLELIVRPGFREYFESMFGDPATELIEQSALPEDELSRILCPVVLMHGRDDATYTPEQSSLRLAGRLAHADVHVFSDCAHSVAHERPREFMAGVRALAGRLDEQAATGSERPNIPDTSRPRSQGQSTGTTT